MKEVCTQHDVIILGAGIGGTLLATILARHGVNVVIVEKGTHPRFALGESTVPETTFLFDVLSKRYDVPEIAHLRNFHEIRAHVSSGCGIKRGFHFAYHREGELHRGEESSQFPTWGPPFGPDVHLFRQDIDAYLLAVAVRYGATAHMRTTANDIEIDSAGVVVRAPGLTLRGRYLVDACGYQSPVARKLGLRETPSPMLTQSRTIFTHMVNVARYDDRGPDLRRHGLRVPFAEGTLHHCFDGGWFWIIPFDNHPSSTNPLCSVGANLDLRSFPVTGRPAEEELWEVVNRFPSIARHLEGARAARDWVTTERVQYSSTRGAGDRFFLLPHSCGAVDALFSNGLAITTSVINALAHRILAAVRDGDFSAERFSYPEHWMQRSIRHHDKLVARSYLAMRHYDVWNAWHRVWMLGATFGATGHVSLIAEWERDGDPRHFDRFEEPPHRGTSSVDIPEFAVLFDRAAAEVDAFGKGELEPGETARRIYRHLGESGLCPDHWDMLNPDQRCPTTFALIPLARLAAWGYLRGPASVRRNFDLRGRIGRVFSAIGRDVRDEVQRSAERVTTLIRNTLF